MISLLLIALFALAPAHAGRLENGTLVIGVTYEPNMKRKVEKTADIWISADGENWENALHLQFQPSKTTIGTKYATIYFPLGDKTSNSVFFTPLNVKKYDYNLMCMELE